MTHLSLFTGVGGLDLAAEMAGFTPAGQCEWADYPLEVLKKRWPDVPKWRDIRTLTKEDFRERTGLKAVDIISGGFPCQPFSLAGTRRGKEDDRYLWPEMLRVIGELRPTWVLGENVAGIVSLALDQVLSDLEGCGYSTRAFVIPACSADAPHRRERVAIVAHDNRKKGGKELSARVPLADAAYARHLRRLQLSQDPAKVPAGRYHYGAGNDRTEQAGRWQNEPGVGRVAYGIPARVDRLKCLGNAVVPQHFYPIFETIARIEIAIRQ